MHSLNSDEGYLCAEGVIEGAKVTRIVREIVKLSFVILLARILYRNREYGISRFFPVMKMAVFTAFFMDEFPFL